MSYVISWNALVAFQITRNTSGLNTYRYSLSVEKYITTNYVYYFNQFENWNSYLHSILQRLKSSK